MCQVLKDDGLNAMRSTSVLPAGFGYNRMLDKT